VHGCGKRKAKNGKAGGQRDITMNSITFTIDRAEVEKISGKKLSVEAAKRVLSMVENDTVLWDDIEKAIAAAVKFLNKR